MDKITNFNRALYLLEGVLSSTFGLSAMILPELFSVGIEQFSGCLFIFLGLAQLFHLSRVYRKEEFWSILLISTAHLFTGALLIRYPIAGIHTLALWITSQFIIIGFMKFLLVYQIYPRSGWSWLLLGGLSSWAAALIILLNWPLTAFWLLGFMTGLNFLAYGLSQIAYGLTRIKSENLTVS